MSSRRPTELILVALAACAVVVGAWKATHRPAPPPAIKDIKDLIAAADRLGWSNVEVTPSTCCLSSSMPPADALSTVGRHTADLDHLTGIVWCERGRACKAGEQVGGWVVYGDPHMIEQLRQLRDQ